MAAATAHPTAHPTAEAEKDPPVFNTYPSDTPEEEEHRGGDLDRFLKKLFSVSMSRKRDSR